MSDLTFAQLQATTDAAGLTGAVTAAGAIDLAILTGDAIDGTSGIAEGLMKLLTYARQSAVENAVGLNSYSAVTESVIPSTDTEPVGVRLSVTLTTRMGVDVNDITNIA